MIYQAQSPIGLKDRVVLVGERITEEALEGCADRLLEIGALAPASVESEPAKVTKSRKSE